MVEMAYEIRDPKCGKTPNELYSQDMIDEFFGDNNHTPDDYAREDGTFNPSNGHFLCDQCYIEAGMPSSPTGWTCP